MGRGEVPFRQIGVDEGIQRLWLAEQLCTKPVNLTGCVLQGFLYQLGFGREMGIETSMGQTQ